MYAVLVFIIYTRYMLIDTQYVYILDSIVLKCRPRISTRDIFSGNLFSPLALLRVSLCLLRAHTYRVLVDR
jgi:hypothetical protein